ncbi:MAG: hypothetical protein ACLQPH_18265 [Acidimicrobiales bacterium]
MSTPAGTRPSREAIAVVLTAVAARPGLWWAGLGALRRLAAPGWWRSPPHLPLPDRRLWAFRMVTAYGDPTHDPAPADVIAYLDWCRATGGPRRRNRGATVGFRHTNRSWPDGPG